MKNSEIMTNTKNTNIKTEKDVRFKILKGMNKVYKAVSKTMGPHGRTSAIVNDNSNGMPKFTKDGYTVAQAIFESDPFEGIGVGLVKDVVNQTVATSWDGTSISTVLSFNMFANGFIDVKDSNYNVTEYKRGMELAGKDIVEILRSIKQVDFDKKSIHNIALTSSNGDEELAKCISDNYEAFSNKKSFANITINPVSFGKTRIEVSDGYKLMTVPFGALYAMNRDRGALLSKNDKFLVFDTAMYNYDDFIDRLAFLDVDITNSRTGEGLEETVFIVAPNFGKEFAEGCVDAFKSGYNIVMIQAPFYGEVQLQYIQDFATMVNATVQSYDATNLEFTFDIEDIGLSKGSQLTEQFFHVNTGINEDGVYEYLSRYGISIEEWKESYEERKVLYLERLENMRNDSRLTKGEVSIVDDRISSIHGIEIKFFIQSLSEVEVIERIDRAQDALHAVISALDEGFISGGGTTLFKISNYLMDSEDVEKKLNKMAVTNNKELISGYVNVINSIRRPFLQILENAGFVESVVTDEFLSMTDYEDMSGVNVKTGKMVDNMIKEGIIDPVKVAVSAITNSIASISTALTINSGLYINNDNSLVNTGFDIRSEEGNEVLNRDQLDEMLAFSQGNLTQPEIDDIAEKLANK